MKKPKAIVLDSWPVMAYLEDEPSAGKIGTMIADAQDDGTQLLMSVVNAGEVWYTLARRRSTKDADETLVWLREVGVRIVNADWDLTNIAAAFKARGNISYADCFAAALAKHNQAALITGDREFEQLEKEVEIVWL